MIIALYVIRGAELGLPHGKNTFGEGLKNDKQICGNMQKMQEQGACQDRDTQKNRP